MASIDDLLPPAKDFMKKLAVAEAEEAAKQAKKDAEAAAEKQALLDHLKAPSGVSDEERMKRAAVIINRAVSNGLTEVMVGTFPNQVCTDRGRAINQQEPGWENTLTGLPKELIDFWKKHLQPRGYRVKCQVVNFPNGVPGDIGIILSWN